MPVPTIPFRLRFTTKYPRNTNTCKLIFIKSAATLNFNNTVLSGLGSIMQWLQLFNVAAYILMSFVNFQLLLNYRRLNLSLSCNIRLLNCKLLCAPMIQIIFKSLIRFLLDILHFLDSSTRRTTRFQFIRT